MTRHFNRIGRRINPKWRRRPEKGHFSYTAGKNVVPGAMKRRGESLRLQCLCDRQLKRELAVRSSAEA